MEKKTNETGVVRAMDRAGPLLGQSIGFINTLHGY
jgi:hypothetical protein